MIPDAEIRRVARAYGVEPRIVELDYVLGWALQSISRHEFLSRRLVFKGGTCLRKCYFPDYRFSEDLDFTAIAAFDREDIERAITDAFAEAEAGSGIDFTAMEPRFRILDNEYGRETLKATFYWRGPHALRGSPRGLRLDITRHETLEFELLCRPMVHAFSDSVEIGTVELRCYSLEEVMAEKIRAVLGQRIYAVSRDLYDIAFLRPHVDDEKVRKDEFEADWERNLVHLVPEGEALEFAFVWEVVVGYVRDALVASSVG